MRRLLLAAVARAYLRKPDQAEFLASRLVDARGLLDAARNELAFRLGALRAPVLHTLNVELTSRCNVACSYCDVNRGLGRPATDLDPGTVAALLDAAPRVRTLLPFQWGEPLLYEPLDEVVADATRRGVRTYLTTNGTHLDADRFSRLARAGLARLTVSIDGDEATHRARRGYDQAPILARLAEARALQRRERLSTRLDVSMVVDASLAGRLGEFRDRFEPLCDRVQFIPRLVAGPRSVACREPSRGVLVVLSNGKLTTCCADVRGDLALGTLREALHSPAGLYAGEAFAALRARHRRGDLPEPCAGCDECAPPGVSRRFR